MKRLVVDYGVTLDECHIIVISHFFGQFCLYFYKYWILSSSFELEMIQILYHFHILFKLNVREKREER
jgi:hypothetical protein